MRDKKRRGHSRYYLYFILSLMGLFALSLSAFYALRHLSIFELRDVNISGNKAVPDSSLYQISDKYIGQNLFRLPLRQMKEEFKTLSRVKDARIQRHLLSKLKIQIFERSGLLYVKSFEGNLYPLGEDGVVLNMYNKVYREDLPIYSSYYPDKLFEPGHRLEKADIMRIISLHKKIQKEAGEYLHIISEYYMIDNTINIIDARFGTRIIPSDEELATQFKRYEFVQDNGNIEKRSVVDLRFENQVVVKGATK